MSISLHVKNCPSASSRSRDFSSSIITDINGVLMGRFPPWSRRCHLSHSAMRHCGLLQGSTTWKAGAGSLGLFSFSTPHKALFSPLPCTTLDSPLPLCMFRSLAVRSSFVPAKSSRLLSCTTTHTRSYSSATFGNMASLGGHSKKHKVTIVGSGNWYVFRFSILA